MHPYFLTSNIEAPGLYRLKDGRYQLVEPGPVTPFMSGYRYLLVERALADFLESAGVAGAAFRDAVIWDSKRDLEYSSHAEVVIHRQFSAGRIHDIDWDGCRILMMDNRYVFVSPGLKMRLENSPFPYLVFSEGLTGFA